MIFPLENFSGDSAGETLLWRKFKQFLPEAFLSFHGYSLGLRCTDIIMLVPEKGVLIIENKSYLAKNIVSVPDKNTIIRKNAPADYSPFEQARKYKEVLIDDFLLPDGINSVYVLHAVIYPFINEEEYIETGLNKVSPRILTFLSEDIRDSASLLGKIDSIFDEAYSAIHQVGLVKNGFHSALMKEVANLISPNYANIEVPEEDHSTYIEDTISCICSESFEYSLLIYSSDGSEFSGEELKRLTEKWRLGTKLQLYTSNCVVFKELANHFANVINSMGLASLGFAINNNISFRLEIGLADAIGADIKIANGIGMDVLESSLIWLSGCSSFNLGQYQMEHAPSKNIIVKAGAGTGKTFSLVSRINYLLWKKSVPPEELPSFLAMVTFTNESAMQMKQSLANNFMKYYQLTGQTVYLNYLEATEGINISTIHSLAKKLISIFACKLGLGKDFKITTGTYQRSQILRAQLNNYLASHPEFKSTPDMTMFYLEKRLSELLDKFDNKNIDLVLNSESLDFGSGDEALCDELISILIATQTELNKELAKNNSLALGSLIRVLRQLISVLSEADIPDAIKIKYLFIDEFQDTDDVQIELVNEFQKLIGFNFFVVGDIKQCIYRFRGAEEAAFDHLKENFRSEDIYELSLSKNYRTDSELLNQMNKIFSEWDKLGNLDYSGSEILTGTIKYDDHEPIHCIAFNEYSGSNDELVRLIKSVTKLARERRQTVAILVRYNYQVEQIVALCHENNIYVETDIAGELFSADPTIDLFKLLMALRYNNEPEYLYNLYTTSYVSAQMPKIDLINLSRDELISRFYNNPPIKNWDKYLLEVRRQPILKVLQDIINSVNPWEVFATKASICRDERDRNIRFYMRNLDQVFENLVRISNTDYLTINKLTDYLETMILTRKDANAREPFGVTENSTCLLCTTVHKSKGAEYDTVILPFCSFDISCAKSKGTVDVIYSKSKIGYRLTDSKKKAIYFNNIYTSFQSYENDSRRKEETRILYVALTRTKRSLYYFSPDKRGRNLTWTHLLKGGV